MTYTRSDKIQKPGIIRVAAKCHKCGGAGGAQAWAYTGWTCYRCGGSGAEPNGEKVYAYPSNWTEEQVAEHVAKRESQSNARAERKAAKIAAEHAEWLGTQPDELTQMIANRSEWTHNSFISDILIQGSIRTLTERQVEAVLEAAKKDVERQAQVAAELVAAESLPLGTVTIEGEILAIKSQENRYGYGSSSLKMLVKGNGWKVWGTFPTKLYGAEVGDTVRFVAEVSTSDDPTFGFFSRPKNAEVVKEACNA